MNAIELPDGSGFFIGEVGPPMADPIAWNPWNKVVQDHRDGTIHQEATNVERAKQGLPIPWTPSMAEVECRQPGIA